MSPRATAMEIKTLSAACSVSGQVLAEDLPALAQSGFRAIICNRPDREAEDQPDFRAIEQAAREAGIEARYLPVVGHAFTTEQVRLMAGLLKDLPAPVLAYCRSGTRSTLIWGLATALD